MSGNGKRQVGQGKKNGGKSRAKDGKGIKEIYGKVGVQRKEAKFATAN